MPRGVFLALLLVVIAACGDATGDTIIFGEGEIPSAVPSDFPLPADAVIGSTLVDTINTKSEFEFRTATNLSVLVQFLSVRLVEAGYVIDESSGDLAGWSLTFRRGSLQGDVLLRSLGGEASQGAVTVNDT
jgi:hypothetical protein